MQITNGKSKDTRTVRGIITRGEGGAPTSGGRQRIQIFDGDFETGYVIEEFRVFGFPNAETGTDIYGLITTNKEPSGVDDGADWDWSQNEQIAWSLTTFSGAGATVSEFNLVDPDHMLIEDFYIWFRFGGGAGESANYYVRMRKVDTSDHIAALAMVRNKAQGGPVE